MFAEHFPHGPHTILDAKDTKQRKSLPHRALFLAGETEKQLRKAEKFSRENKELGGGAASERAESKDCTARAHLEAEESELSGWEEGTFQATEEQRPQGRGAVQQMKAAC